MKKVIFLAVFVGSLLVSGFAHSGPVGHDYSPTSGLDLEGKIDEVSAGEIVKFDGYLLDAVALSKILTESNAKDEIHKAEMERLEKTKDAEIQRETALLQAEIDFWKQRSEDIDKFRSLENKQYNEILKRKMGPRLEGPAFAGGVVVGVITAIIATSIAKGITN